MRYPVAFALVATASTASAGHVAVSFSREPFSPPHASSFTKRQESEPLPLEAFNNITGGGYYSEFEIGTPPQKISFLLDTGSSDTWMNSVDADICDSDQMQMMMGYCQPQFNQKKSSSFKLVQKGGFDITYLDSRNIQGDYFKDNVRIGDITIKNQQLGLARKSVRPTGIMGLGFSSNVAAQSDYPTIVDNLVDQGFIDTPAFSLYMNDLSTDSGSILFGGIDTQKFIGELAILPMIPDYKSNFSVSNSSDPTSFTVALNGFDVISPSGETKVNLMKLDSFSILDSGSTISLLPDDQVQVIWDEFGVQSFQDVLTPFIDCAYAGKKGEGYVFQFVFDGKTIDVPMDEMVIDAYKDFQESIFNDPTLSGIFDGWEGACMFGIGSTADFGFTTNKFSLLGATFLRSAYAVYDLANEQIAIAQANVYSTEEDIVEIKPGKLPKVVGVEQQTKKPDNPSKTPGSSDPKSTKIVDGVEDASGRVSPPMMAVTAMIGFAALFSWA